MPMRRVSLKRQRLNRQADPIRRQILEERGPRCQVCRNIRPLACHEISRGPDRWKSLACRHAILAVCGQCNTGPLNRDSEWPKARQLALLMLTAPADYDLDAFNALIAPKSVLQSEVDSFVPELQELGYGRLFDQWSAC